MMNNAMRLMILLALLLLAACGSDSIELSTYLEQADRSREAVRTLADEQMAWRREHESRIGSRDFCWDQARNHFAHLVDSIERESAELAGLDVPKRAVRLHQSVLSFYGYSAEMYRRQVEVMDLLERISSLQDQANSDQAFAQALVDRYGVAQRELETVADRIRESAGRSQIKRNRLAASP